MPLEDLALAQYSDADYAGDRPDMHSTSGSLLALVGPHSWLPLAASSTKQTAASHSTAEAEVVAAERATRECGVPALDLWETILRTAAPLVLLEDNQTTALNTRTGKFPKTPAHSAHAWGQRPLAL